MKRVFILLVSVLVLSCNQKPNQTETTETETNTAPEVAENLDWLLGNWKRVNEEEGKETFENWEKLSPSEYSGIGFTMQKGDTISQEQMRFVESNGKWSLFVTTLGETEATEFQMTELKSNEFVCTNETIDFPTRIHYWVEGQTLKAKIANDEMEIPFDFERVK